MGSRKAWIISEVGNSRNTKTTGLAEEECVNPGFMSEISRNIRSADIRPSRDIGAPLPRGHILHIDAEMCHAGIRGTEIIPGVSEIQISGFGGAKCDEHGFKEVKNRNVRTRAIRHLPDS